MHDPRRKTRDLSGTIQRRGKLRVPWGYVAALQSDPIEKKPFFHVIPGTNALTFGMLGCDYHCGYCQNWLTSQAMRDPASDVSAQFVRKITPQRNGGTSREGQRLRWLFLPIMNR